jgi:hypothetical protein
MEAKNATISLATEYRGRSANTGPNTHRGSWPRGGDGFLLRRLAINHDDVTYHVLQNTSEFRKPVFESYQDRGRCNKRDFGLYGDDARIRREKTQRDIAAISKPSAMLPSGLNLNFLAESIVGLQKLDGVMVGVNNHST